MGGLRVVHDHGVSISVFASDVEIARYMYEGDMPLYESPKPYFHPLRTLSGAVVTAYRPHDHRWHKGLAMTLTDVSGCNFWGGPTYVDGPGYVALDNNGVIRHDGFDTVRRRDDEVEVVERLRWAPARQDPWIAEHRGLRVHDVDRALGTWALDVGSSMHNMRGEPLVLGSPTTAGRELAGYTGLFWRGPRGFTGGDVFTADEQGAAAMGTSAPWLAYSGQHDEVDGGATLLWIEAPDNPPVRWFVRNDPFPAVAPSPAFFDELTIPVGGTLRLRHRVVIADGRWDRPAAQSYVDGHRL